MNCIKPLCLVQRQMNTPLGCYLEPPPSSKRVLIFPVRSRRVASGLIIDNVRSIGMNLGPYLLLKGNCFTMITPNISNP